MLINSANINIEPDWFVWVFDIDRMNYLSYVFSIIYLLPFCAHTDMGRKSLPSQPFANTVLFQAFGLTTK